MGENGWLCESPQLRFWRDDSKERVWGNPEFRLGGNESKNQFGGASMLQALLGKNKRQGGLLESPPLKVRFSASKARRDRFTLQTFQSVRGVPPSPRLPQIRGAYQNCVRLASAKLGRRVPPRPPPQPPHSGIPPPPLPPARAAPLTWSSAGSSGSGSRGVGRCVSLRVGK